MTQKITREFLIARRRARMTRPRRAMAGLGDLIAQFAMLFGIKPCRGCNKRRARLNRLIPF